MKKNHWIGYQWHLKLKTQRSQDGVNWRSVHIIILSSSCFTFYLLHTQPTLNELPVVSDGSRKRPATEESSDNSTIDKPPEPKIPKTTDCDVISLQSNKEEGTNVTDATSENVTETTKTMDSPQLKDNEHLKKELMVEEKDTNSVATTATDS